MPQQYSKLIDIASELNEQDFILRGLQCHQPPRLKTSRLDFPATGD